MIIAKPVATKLAAAALCCAVLALAGCGDKKKNSAEGEAVAGQVVAKVNGKEVTIHELDAERRAMAGRIDPNDDKADRELLHAVVERKLLAAKAEAAGLDRQAAVLLAIRRAREALLAQNYLEQEVAKRAPVARADIDKFILDNPQMFGQRQTFAVDEIAVPTSQLNDDFMTATKSAKNLDDIEKALKDKKIDYHHVVGALNSAELAPEFIDHLAHPKADDVLLLKSPQTTLFMKVLTSRSDPLGSDQAVEVARRILQTKANAAALRELSEGAATGANVEYEGPYAKLMAPDAAADKDKGAASDNKDAPKQQ